MITIKKLFGNQCQPQKTGQVKKFLSIVAILSLVFSPVTPAFAATYYWDTAGSMVWETGANWSDNSASGGTTGVVPGGADSAVFNQSTLNGNMTFQLGANHALAGLTIRNTGTTLIDSNLQGTTRTLSINTGGITVNSGAGAVNIGYNHPTNPVLDQPLNITLLGAQAWTNNSSNTLTIVNAVAGGANLLTVTGTGNTSITGAIADAGGGVAKTGTGTLTLSGANTYVGGTTMGGGGKIVVGHDTALGSGGLTLGIGGGILEASGTRSVANNIDTKTNGLFISGADALTLSGNITSTAGTGGIFVKSGDGTLTLTGTNTFDAHVYVNAGALNLNSAGGAIAGAFDFDVNGGTVTLQQDDQIANTKPVWVAGGTLAIGAESDTVKSVKLTAGSITGTTGVLTSTTAFDMQNGSVSAILGGAGVALNKTTDGSGGGGTVTLSGVNTYTGLTTVSAGVLKIQDGSALGTAAGGTVVADGAALEIDNHDTTMKIASEALTLNGTGVANAGALRGVTGTGSTQYEGDIVLGSNARINSDAGTLNVGAFWTPGTITGNHDLIVGGASGTVINDSIQIGTGKLTVDGGALSLGSSTANTYTGLTEVSAGTLYLDKTGVTAVAGNLKVSGTGSLTWNQNNQVADTSTITMTSGSIKLNGMTETVTAFANSGGTFSTGAGHLIGTGATVTWSGGTNTINNGGTVEDGHIVITGGTNTVEGGVTGGVLQLNSDGGAGLEMTGATLTLNSDAGVAGKLILKDNVETFASATTSNISNGGAAINSGTVDLNGGTRTFTVANGTAAEDLAISAVITNGAVTKAGDGTMLLSAANTYAGATTINAGTVIAAANSALGTDAAGATVASGATLGFQGGITYSTAEAVTINGSGYAGRSGAIDNISGDNSFSGPVTLGSASTIGFTAGTLTLDKVDGAQDLTLAGAGNITFNGAVGSTAPIGDAGGAAITINSTGATIFSSTLATASGITSVNGAGAITFKDAVTIAAGDTATTLNNAVVNLDGLTFTSAGDVTFGNNASGDQVNLTGASVTVTTAAANKNQVYDAKIDGAQNLALAAGSGTITVNGIVGTSAGHANNLTSFTVTSAALADLNNVFTAGAQDINATNIHLNGTAYESTAAGDLSFTGATTLAANSTITSDGAAGDDIIFDGAGTINGAFTLNLVAGAGNVNVGGIVGGTAPLTSFTVTSAATADLNNVFTTGAQDITATNIDLKGTSYSSTTATTGPIHFHGAVDLTLAGATTTVTTAGGAGDDILFSSTIDDDSQGNTILTLNAGVNGDVAVSGAIGSGLNCEVKALNITGNVISLYGLGNAAPVRSGVDGATIVDASAGATGAINLTGVTYYTGGSQTYNAGAAQTIQIQGGLAGAQTTIGLSGSTASFTGKVDVNNRDFEVNTTYAADAGANITFNQTINDVAGSGALSDLTLNGGTGGAVTLAGAIGNTDRLSTVTVTKGAQLDLNDVRTVNAQSYTATNIDLNSTTYNSTAGSITFNGAVNLYAAVTIDTSAGVGNIDLDAVALGANLLTINNSGASVATISGIVSSTGAGNGLTKQGTGTLTLTGDNTFAGILSVEKGTLSIGTINNASANGVLGNSSNAVTLGSAGAVTGTLSYTGTTASSTKKFTMAAGGTGDFAVTTAGTTLTLGGLIDGTGSLAKSGAGTLLLSNSNGYSGATAINAGTLQVSNATALGIGNVTNGATLAIGTTQLTAGGTYIQTGTLTLTANSASSYGTVTALGGGASSVAGTIDVNVAGYIPNGATLSVVTTTGALTYGATTITVSGDTKYSFTGALSGNILILTATTTAGSFANAAPAGNSNARAVGVVLDGVANANPTGDMLVVIDTLNGESSTNAGNAIATMTPDVSLGTAEASRSTTANALTMISNRLGGARCGFVGTGVSAGEMLNGVGVWMQGLGSNMKQGERKGIQGYNANLFGTTIGADKVIDDHFRAGFAGGYGWARVNSKQPGSPSDDINSYQATIYGSFDSLDLNKARQHGKKSYEAVRSQVENSWYVDGMVNFTQNNYDSRREIWLTPSNKRVAKSDHYGQQYSTNFEAGYKFVFEETKALEVTPFVSLGYNYLYMNSYKEKGANALNLSVQGEGFSQLEQGLGTKLAYPIVAKKVGTFIPSAKAAWLYDYIGDRFETTASFAGGGSSFNTVGAKPAKNGMLFGAELAFLNKGNMTVTGNWDIELKDQFMSNTYYGTVRYDF